MVVSPEEAFDLKTINQRLLKPKYRILFDIVQKVLMAFSGTHESVMPPKLKCIIAIIWRLTVNLINLFLEEPGQISQNMEGNKAVEVKIRRPLCHGCKVSVLLHSLITYRI